SLRVARSTRQALKIREVPGSATFILAAFSSGTRRGAMIRSGSFKCGALGLLAGLAVGFVGCGGVEDEPAAPASSPLTVPVPTINQFVVLASHGASFDDRSMVSGGDLGVAASTTAVLNTLTGGSDARVGVGEVLLAQHVVLRDRAVAGEI